jgi:hypothetical protein
MRFASYPNPLTPHARLFLHFTPEECTKLNFDPHTRFDATRSEDGVRVFKSDNGPIEYRPAYKSKQHLVFSGTPAITLPRQAVRPVDYQILPDKSTLAISLPAHDAKNTPPVSNSYTLDDLSAACQQVLNLCDALNVKLEYANDEFFIRLGRAPSTRP